jgi:uncharacterized small protein (DUF1192 family)
MKTKFFFVVLIFGVALGTGTSAEAAAISITAADPQIATLQAKLEMLQAELDALTGATVIQNEKQNLSISSARLKKDTIEGSVEELEDQRITILVKNNRYGGKALSKKRFGYLVELYEVVKEKRTKVGHAWSGFALVPTSELKSEFRIDIDSDLYVGKDDRTFVAKVTIDEGRLIKESSEKDNVKWTKAWTITGSDE